MEALEASICVYEEQLRQVEASILATAPTSDEELVNLKNGENDICTIYYVLNPLDPKIEQDTLAQPLKITLSDDWYVNFSSQI